MPDSLPPDPAPLARRVLPPQLARIALGQWLGGAAVALVLAVTVWTLAAADGGSSRERGGSADPGAPATTSSSSSSTTTTTQFRGVDASTLDATVTDLLAFLAEHHGSEAAHDLDVDVGAERRLADPADVVGEALASSPLMTMLGLTGEEEGDAPAWHGEAASYDAEHDRVVVAAERLGVDETARVLRALVYALHLQAVPLPDGPPDALLARVGLVEADAGRMVALYEAAAGPERGNAGPAGRTPGETAGSPLRRLLDQAVAAGSDFVATAARQGTLDEVLEEPPTTTEQLLHPDRYFFGETGLDVPAAQPQGEALERGGVGELTLAVALRDAVAERDALDAADGWGGDATVVWDGDGGPEAVVRVVMDSSIDRTELVEALDEWRRWHGRARVAVDGRTVEVRLSGPPRRP